MLNPIAEIRSIGKRGTAMLETILVTRARDKDATISRLKIARAKFAEATVALDEVLKEIERVEQEMAAKKEEASNAG